MALSSKESLNSNIGILRARASKTAMQGVVIAVCAVVVSTLGVAYTTHGLSLDGIIHAQTENFVLWVLDGMPFVFGYIGQYASYVIAHEAGAMVMAQTEELREHANQLEQKAAFVTTHDPVTELPNRVLFNDRLERAISIANVHHTSLAVLLLSVENFKEFQDAFGPASADLLLKQLATRLKSWSKGEDSVARVDSNSFAILLANGLEKSEVEAVAHNLHKALEPSFALNQMRLTLQASIGIVLFPEHGEDADTLLQRAGVALYVAAKAHNGYAIYSPALDERSPRRLTLMAELRRAIERSELTMHYQPKININSAKVIGAEALVRWNHPNHGFIPPDEFIGLAERTRLIQPLTRWVMERVFLDCASFHQAGYDLIISLNLSTQDLRDPEFPDIVAGVMARTGVEPEWLILEITESSIMSDPGRVLNVIERIHSMGFNFSIDDFGTGYSSLAYLKKLPVSELKIDKSFVMDMLASNNDAVIVRATIDLAHNLGLKVTAEGVENRETLDALNGYGCDIAQGYLLSKPIKEDRFRQWLTESEWAVPRQPALTENTPE